MPVSTLLRKFLWVGLTAFGAGRWTNLHAAFVRTGLIREEDFMRDLAVTLTLPGAGFVNLSGLCGRRLGGFRMAGAGVALVALPGTIAIVAAMAFLSADDPHVAHLFNGIVIGAVAAIAAALTRTSRSLRGYADVVLALGTLALAVAGLPVVWTIAVVGPIAVAWYRFGPDRA